MTDLRALLGDKYDDVIARAGAALHDDDYPGERRCDLCEEHAARTIAAVLPDLLAEANTRADEAEAKARRFANLLGNNAKALNDVLPREVLRQKAEAWDEGVGACARSHGHLRPMDTNPYRTETR